jgi:flagellar motility protein MotE (MotC chaperone)
MSPRLRIFGRSLLWLAAANFLALVAMVVALSLSGSVSPARWHGALLVLRGASRSVGLEEYERLRAVERAHAERVAMPEERVLVESWRKLKAEKWRAASRGAEQFARLALMASFVEGERDKLDTALDRFRAEREAEKEQQRLAQEQLREAASEKLQRLYRYMRPDSIAADLESRMAGGRADEVAEIVKAMPERAAAEVLEAFSDPAKRNELYDLMAGRTASRATDDREMAR